jgi:hypothetical protein
VESEAVETETVELAPSEPPSPDQPLSLNRRLSHHPTGWGTSMSRSGELRRALTEGDGETGGRCGDEELFGTSDGRVGAAEDRRGRELDRRLALRAGGDAQAADPFDREWNSFGRTVRRWRARCPSVEAGREQAKTPPERPPRRDRSLEEADQAGEAAPLLVVEELLEDHWLFLMGRISTAPP